MLAGVTQASYVFKSDGSNDPASHAWFVAQNWQPDNSAKLIVYTDINPNKKDFITKKPIYNQKVEPVMKIYPNPLSSENLTLEYSGFKEDSKITITIRDLSGRVLFMENDYPANNRLILHAGSMLSKGMYIITAESCNAKISKPLIVVK